MSAFRVYSRPGCHLCELLIESLLALVRDTATVEVVDIDSQPDLARAFNDRIPVLEFAGREVCHYHLDERAVRQILRSLPESLDSC